MMTNRLRGVDLVVLVDMTCNMKSEISDLKRGLKKMFEHYFGGKSKGACYIQNWRAKVVGYRNVNHDHEWIINNPFVSDIDDVEKQLCGIETSDQKSLPALIDALLTVSGMGWTDCQRNVDGWQWRSRYDAIRVVVVLTNSPYEPYALGEDFNKATYEDVARKMAEKRIILYIVTPGEPFDKSVSQAEFEDCYKKLAMVDKAEYFSLRTAQGWAIKLSGVDFLETFLKTCIICNANLPKECC